MAIGEERGVGEFMRRFSAANQARAIRNGRERMAQMREQEQEDAANKKSGSIDIPQSKPASESGLNAKVEPISVGRQANDDYPSEARVGAGVGGSTGRMVHFDPSKAPSYLDAIAQKHGIDPNDFKRMAWIESKFDPNARADSSSAGGLFQFTDGTARSYGLSNKFDGQANAEAAARLWSDNKAQLTKALGREPTSGELYLAHQQGLGGAKALLSNPNASAASLVGSNAVVNNGGSSHMTAGEFARMWTNKFDSLHQSASADGSTPRNRDAGNEQSPVRVAAADTIRNDAISTSAPPAATTPTTTATPAATTTNATAAPATGEAGRSILNTNPIEEESGSEATKFFSSLIN